MKTDICAWDVAEAETRIQINNLKYRSIIMKMPDIRLVGYSVAGPYLMLYGCPYHVRWVQRYLNQIKGCEFTLKFDASFSETLAGAAFDLSGV